MALSRRGGSSRVLDPEKYRGFKGAFDRDTFVFESTEERDRFQVATYGHVRNGWREPDEPTDERPAILHGACRCRGCRRYQREFWRDETERMTYEDAVAANPRGQGEGPATYIKRIGSIVAGKYAQIKPSRMEIL